MLFDFTIMKINRLNLKKKMFSMGFFLEKKYYRSANLFENKSRKLNNQCVLFAALFQW